MFIYILLIIHYNKIICYYYLFYMYIIWKVKHNKWLKNNYIKLSSYILVLLKIIRVCILYELFGFIFTNLIKPICNSVLIYIRKMQGKTIIIMKVIHKNIIMKEVILHLKRILIWSVIPKKEEKTSYRGAKS